MRVQIDLSEALANWLADYGGNVEAGILAAARVAGFTGSVRHPITVSECMLRAAEQYGVAVARNVITTACQRHALTARKSGDTWLVDSTAFDAWLARYVARETHLSR
ncbi:MAG: hypothetical protein IPK79_00515 [Vampirovibrionales bacterium]|nr:hypothetical protein [Vampirovibrionales bacterium]